MNWLTKAIATFLFSLAILISYLPLKVLYLKSRFIAFILRDVLGYRKQVVIQNLSRSFPQLKYKEIQSITHQFYLHFSDVFIEVIKSISISKHELQKRFKVENPTLLDQYYDKGYTVIGLTGHVSNWEWLSIVPSLYTFPCFTLYKPLRNKIAEHLMTRIRMRFGMKLLSMGAAPRYILSHKDQCSLYIFIGDQSPAKVDNAEEFTFLNQTTTFFSGGVKLARATKAAVVYISIRQTKKGFYSVNYIPICSPNDNMSEKEMLSSYARLLELDIKTQPANWLWSHKRWKR